MGGGGGCLLEELDYRGGFIVTPCLLPPLPYLVILKKTNCLALVNPFAYI